MLCNPESVRPCRKRAPPSCVVQESGNPSRYTVAALAADEGGSKKVLVATGGSFVASPVTSRNDYKVSFRLRLLRVSPSQRNEIPSIRGLVKPGVGPPASSGMMEN